MKQKNIIVMVILILCVMISITGCNKAVQNGKESNANDGSQAVGKADKASKSLPTKLEDPNITVFFTGQPNDAMDIVNKQFEEKYGGKVQYELTDWNDRVARITALINGGIAPDVCIWTESEHPKYMINNLLKPIDEYFDLSDSLWNMNAMNQGKYKGQFYGIDNNINAFLIYFNKSLFENNALKTPLEYYNEGKWDWETFRELAMKLTRDTDGDGNIDQWGFTGRESPMIFAIANDTDFVELKVDGGIELAVNDTKLIEALQFLQDSYIKDKYNNQNSKKWKEDFVAGKIAMCVERKVHASGSNLKESMKYDWDIAPFPIGPSGKKGVAPGAISYWGIANGAKNPKGGAAWIHLKKVFDNNEIEPGLANNFTEAQLKLITELEKNVQNPKYTGIGTMTAKVNGLLTDLKNGVPVVSAIEKRSPIFQIEIDLTLGAK